ncbi:Hypothetical protein D9617_3g017920 [Elsinoe fawcettii]|nr:Hypothetical protein D9617_3g017920 [Elsinoe fawcettii]
MSKETLHAIRHPWLVPEVSPEPDNDDEDLAPEYLAANPTWRDILARHGVSRARQDELVLTHNRRVVKIRGDGEFLKGLQKYIHPRNGKQIERLIGRYLMRLDAQDKELEKQYKDSMVSVIGLSARAPRKRVMFKAATQCATLWHLSRLAEDLLEEKREVELRKLRSFGGLSGSVSKGRGERRST